MPLLTSTTRARGHANDIKRRLLLPPGYRFFMLKRAGETKRFSVVLEVTSGYYTEYSDWRQQLGFFNQTLDTSFPDKVAQTTHCAAGVPIVDVTTPGQYLLDVYGIDPNRRDVVPPTVANSGWKIYMTREPKERFILPS
jgi:hypothetical protein